MLRNSSLMLALGMAWGLSPGGAMAQVTGEAEPEPTALSEVTVSATRTARRNDNIPSTVTVTHADEIEQQGARDIKELFKDELDVTVSQLPNRFSPSGQTPSGRGGNESINIRGLEGNRVLMMVDGIRVPNSFSYGPFSTGRGDYLEVNGFSAVEVLRGPASTQYGSDGLAGAVNFRTFDPADLLKPQQSRAGLLRGGYATEDKSNNLMAAASVRQDRWQALVLASARRGHELKNQGDNNAQNASRTAPNPQSDRGRYVLAKGILTLDAAQQLGFTLESQHRKQDTEVYSARSASTQDLRARDQITRERYSLEHRFKSLNAPWVQSVVTRLYVQDAEVQQATDEQRLARPLQQSNSTYRQNELGLSTQWESNVGVRAPQRVSYGLEWSRANVRSQRTGSGSNRATLPSKPFPDTIYTLGGVFVQDEIEAGAVSVIPGLRFDHYTLSPSQNGYAGVPVALSGQALTPRLGVVWRLDPRFAPYAQWARGFRAPTPDQVNNNFSNPAHGYSSIGNPRLQAERAESIELGVRGKLSQLRYALSAYDNHYRDFISQENVGGNGRPGGQPMIFQYVNLAQAHIRGLELRSEWSISKAWILSGGAAYARGTSSQHGVTSPLNSVNPLRMALGLRYEQERWGARADLQHSASKAQSQIKTPTSRRELPQFATPAYTVLDLGAHWKPWRQFKLGANLNNVFNLKYWRWSDVRGLDSNSPIKDAYTAPGRNLQLSARYDF